MSRREIVVLVSRALAIIQLVTVALEVSYLPQSLTSLGEHIGSWQSPQLYGYLSRYYIEGTLALILRIAFLLLTAHLLWKCGPKIENFLLPAAPVPKEPTASVG